MECKPKTHSLAPTQKKGVKNLVETRRNLNKLFQRKVKLHTKKKRRQLLHQSPYVNVMNLHQGFESFEKIKLSI
jgi:hypothetical protein